MCHRLPLAPKKNPRLVAYQIRVPNAADGQRAGGAASIAQVGGIAKRRWAPERRAYVAYDKGALHARRGSSHQKRGGGEYRSGAQCCQVPLSAEAPPGGVYPDRGGLRAGRLRRTCLYLPRRDSVPHQRTVGILPEVGLVLVSADRWLRADRLSLADCIRAEWFSSMPLSGKCCGNAD